MLLQLQGPAEPGAERSPGDRSQATAPLCPAPSTSTMRDSSCSTDSGSRPCRAVLICLFIRVYLCRARWCLCNTPFSCRSHRSYGEAGAVLGQAPPKTHSHAALLAARSDVLVA